MCPLDNSGVVCRQSTLVDVLDACAVCFPPLDGGIRHTFKFLTVIRWLICLFFSFYELGKLTAGKSNDVSYHHDDEVQPAK